MRDPLEGLVCALSLVLVRMGVARTAQVRLLHGGWASRAVDAERPVGRPRARLDHQHNAPHRRARAAGGELLPWPFSPQNMAFHNHECCLFP